jgi:predicted ATPase/tRNA A-37 threonylcarbamoyl transferase component Bud32
MTLRIANRYNVEYELGVGGMGTVFRGWDTEAQQHVAIKRLRSEVTEPELLERFKREGEALRELNHPNIVKLLDTIEEDGNHYLVMEYLSGGDLSVLLRAGAMSIEKVLQIAIDLCDALARAHRLEIIHRDLKPANVLLAPDGTPRLTDFGIAHIAEKERVTATNDIVGTIDYVAPEALSSNDIDTRADIWAFGVLLFEMLTGERPFKGDNIAKTVTGILKESVPDIEKMRPDVPVALADLIYRMLEKDPNVRISSVRYVGVELEYILRRYISGVGETDSQRFILPDEDMTLHPQHNLPAQTTAFIGRETELAELERLINDPDTRLVTIVAPGGMGKTRLSLELARYYITPPQPLPTAVGRDVEGIGTAVGRDSEEDVKALGRGVEGIGNTTNKRFKNGVYFVELAPLTEPTAIVQTIAEAIGFQFASDRQDQKQQLMTHLRPKDMLLVLDNFEHLMDAASLTTELLQEAPNLQILATSRQRLNQTGETVFNLQGMDFPNLKSPDDALDYAAVKFFMQSAKRVRPDFKLTNENLEAVAQICNLVQGLPLGILLATSWLSLLSPQEIAREIANSLDFLESTISDLPARHRSIRAVFDYSWNLMSATEQQVYMKLSVFRGGFSRMAAAGVADANLRTLMSLITKSLIHRDLDTGRYHVHELLRQYGEQNLKASGQYDEVAKAHAKYYLTTIAYFWTGNSLQSPNVVDDITLDYDNVRLALNWGAQFSLLDELRGSLDPLFYYYELRGLVQEGVAQYGKLLETLKAQGTPLSAEWEANVITLMAKLIASIDSQATRKWGEQALAKIDAAQHPEIASRVYNAFGHIAWMLDHYDESLKQYQQSLDYALKSGIAYDIALAQYNVGYLMYNLKRYDEAEAFTQTALTHYERYETHLRRGDIHLLLGNLALVRHDEVTAMQHFTTALEDAKRWRTLFIVSMCIQSLVHLYVKRGEIDKIRATLREGLLAHQAFGQQWQILGFLMGTSRIFFEYIGGRERAVELLAMIANHPEVVSFTQRQVQETLDMHKQHLAAEAYNAAYERGRGLNLADVLKSLVSELGEQPVKE